MTRSERILIVDDEPGVRSSLRAILEDEGFDVSVAGSGEEGLDAAEADLVNVRRLAVLDEVLLELEPAQVGPDVGADRVVAHRQHEGGVSQPVPQGEGHGGRADPGAQSIGPPQVHRDVAVASPADSRPIGVRGS